MIKKEDRIVLIVWTFLATLIDLFGDFPKETNFLILIESIILGALVYFLIGLVILIIINEITKFFIR